MDEELKTKLEELAVLNIELEQSLCPQGGEVSVDFEVDTGLFSQWNAPGHLQICFSPCNPASKLNYEYYDGNHINVYGLGNQWLLLSDTDFI